MASIRSFVAIELETPFLEALGRAQRSLKDRVTLPVRWVAPQGIHLTLKFLGDVEEERLAVVKDALGRAVAGVRPFSIALGDPGAFPSPTRPRVLWVGLQGDVTTLQRLQAQVERELASLGFPKEDRAFQPHLTLGRVREGPRPAHPVSQVMLSEAKHPPSGAEPSPAAGPSQLVQSISLMRSDLRPSGAVYTRLAAVPFAESGPNVTSL